MRNSIGAPAPFVRVVYLPVLLRSLGAALSRHAGLPKDEILVSLGERPGWQVMDGGRVLPSPGDEDDWLEANRAEL